MASGGYGSFTGGTSGPPPPALNASSTLPGSFDPLKRPESEHSLLRRGGAFATAQSGVSIFELILLPWMIVVVVLLCFLEAGAHGYYLTVASIPAILLPLISLWLRHNYLRQRHAEVVLGLLCLIAATIGLSVGGFAVSGSLVEYHRLSQGASYVNVLPSEAGASKIDATTLSFTNQTLVDASRTFGFTDANDRKAKMYCVAPVSDGNLYHRRVQFWAAGINCCEARSNFNCFASGSIGSHGALVLPKEMQANEGFRHAVRGAQGAYDLTAGDNYLLVQWHEDPVGYRNGLWKNTCTLFMIIVGVYLLISVMVGLAALPVINPKVERVCNCAKEGDGQSLPYQDPMGMVPGASLAGGYDTGRAAAAAEAGFGSSSTLPASATDVGAGAEPPMAPRGPRRSGRSLKPACC